MKKYIVMILVVIMCCSLCSCKSEEKLRAEMDEFVESFFSSAEYNEMAGIRFEKYKEKPYFVESILAYMDGLKANVDVRTAYGMMEMFAVQEFNNEQINAAYADIMETYKEYVFEAETMESLVKRLKKLPVIEGEGYYDQGRYKAVNLTAKDFASYFKKNGTLTKTSTDDNGYYKKNASKYKDTAYWYAPLYNKRVNKGEIGTYRAETEYTFYGDFAERESSQKWWTHDGSTTPDDHYYHTMDYKGEDLADDLDVTRLDTIDIIPENTVYYFEEEGSAWSDYFAVVMENQIIMFKGSGYDDIVVVLE